MYEPTAMKPAWPKLKIPVVPMFSWIPSANTPYVVASTPTLIQKSPFVRNANVTPRSPRRSSVDAPGAAEQPLRPDE